MQTAVGKAMLRHRIPARSLLTGSASQGVARRRSYLAASATDAAHIRPPMSWRGLGRGRRAARGRECAASSAVVAIDAAGPLAGGIGRIVDDPVDDRRQV